MELKLIRYSPNKESTGGLLFMNGRFFCYTCEDQNQDHKVPNETRIPAGKYRIKLRDEGGMNKRYHKRFPFHRGMLHLQNVPNFEWIYLHPGNTDDHTSGCILVGYVAIFTNGEHSVSKSTDAYTDLYNYCLLALHDGEYLTIEILDEGVTND